MLRVNLIRVKTPPFSRIFFFFFHIFNIIVRQSILIEILEFGVENSLCYLSDGSDKKKKKKFVPRRERYLSDVGVAAYTVYYCRDQRRHGITIARDHEYVKRTWWRVKYNFLTTSPRYYRVVLCLSCGRTRAKFRKIVIPPSPVSRAYDYV